MMALGKCFLERFFYAVGTYHRSHLQQSTQHNHVKHLAVLHLGSLVHRVNAIDGDVLTCWRVQNAIAIVNQDATRLQLGFKLLQ